MFSSNFKLDFIGVVKKNVIKFIDYELVVFFIHFYFLSSSGLSILDGIHV